MAKPLSHILTVHKSTLARLPHADENAERHQSIVLKEKADLVAAINAAVPQYRSGLREVSDKLVACANNARHIGLLMKKYVDTLPGKQMTPDFWQQHGGQFVDALGNPMTRDMFLWFIKVAENCPDEFEANDFRGALACRQMLLGASGEFVLEGERSPGRAHDKPNYYNVLADILDKDSRAIHDTVKELEKDPNYGSIDTWPDTLRAKVLLQLTPLYQTVEDLRRKLSTKRIET